MTDKQEESKNGTKPKKKIEIKSATSFAKGIKKKWFLWLGGFVVVVFVMAAMMTDPVKTSKKETTTFVDTTPTNTGEKLILTQIQSQLETVQKQLKDQKKEAAEQKKQAKAEMGKLKKEREKAITNALADYKVKQAKERAAREDKSDEAEKLKQNNIYIPPSMKTDGKAVTPPPPPIHVPDGDQPKAAPTPRPSLPRNTVQGGAGQGKPLIITSNDTDDSGAFVMKGSTPAVKKTKKGKGSFLPAGSFTPVAIITGADFGAGKQTQSNPQPTLFRVQSNAFLPGKARYKLRDCFALGSGYGDLSSERAYVQISKLSCVDRTTGEVMQAPVLGYVVDSDGKLGLRGKLVRRQGMLLGKALLAGFAQGAADVASTAAQNAQQTTTGVTTTTSIDTGDLGKAAAFSGAGNAMELLAKEYIDEAKSIFPVIEVNAGRRATIVIQEGAALKWKTPGKEEK